LASEWYTTLHYIIRTICKKAISNIKYNYHYLSLLLFINNQMLIS